MRKMLTVYGAGALAALAACVLLWLSGRYGITQSLGVAIAPSLSAHWLYPRIVWGGLWGLLLLLPFLSGSLLTRSLVLSLFPAMAQLFIVFPYQSQAGVAGLSLGLLTPLVVWFFCWVWALVALISLRLS